MVSIGAVGSGESSNREPNSRWFQRSPLGESLREKRVELWEDGPRSDLPERFAEQRPRVCHNFSFLRRPLLARRGEQASEGVEEGLPEAAISARADLSFRACTVELGDFLGEEGA